MIDEGRAIGGQRIIGFGRQHHGGALAAQGHGLRTITLGPLHKLAEAILGVL